jgi:adenylate cyclase
VRCARDLGDAFAEFIGELVFLDWFRDMSGSDAALDRAFELAKKAVALADNDVMCQVVLGWTHLFRKSFALAEEYYQRALALNPNDPEQIARIGSCGHFWGVLLHREYAMYFAGD